jgi:type IV pilus assembly protein PilX
MKAGFVLAIILVFLSMILGLLYSLNQLILSQNRSFSNYIDREVGLNYAKLALLDAESAAYNMDLANDLEHAADSQCGTSTQFSRANNRYLILSCANSNKNLVAAGKQCNYGAKYCGWCYAPVFDGSYREDPNWRPWEEQALLSPKVRIPCPSYIQFSHAGIKQIPWIDILKSPYARSYTGGDGVLCAAPRYIVEIIDLDYNVAMLKSARLYRITARAFGKNGNTRITLQEYLAVGQGVDSKLISLPLTMRRLLQ